MYETRFGLRHRPFPATPDTARYYPATSHEQALARLLQAIADDEGFALLTGAPGTGKTLLCHCMLQRLGANVTSAFLTNSHFRDRRGLLQAILYDFSLPYDGDEQALRLRLMEFLLTNYREGKRGVLLVDEAHHLTADILEELRLLGNLESGQGKAFQAILIGQPALLETLAEEELDALSQRLAVRTRVEPLGAEEAVDYVLHHLRAAGCRPDNVITQDALNLLARGAAGIPRLLNRAAHKALQLADSADLDVLDAEVVLEALSYLGLEVEEAPMDGGDVLPVPAAQETPAEPGPDGVPVLSLAEGPTGLAVMEGMADSHLFDAPNRPA